MNEHSTVDFSDIGRVIWQYRRYFIYTALFSGVLGLVIAFVLPVYYQSTATVYPAAISYVESTDLVYRRGNINELGDTEQAEQILELFSSLDFRKRIIDQMDLYDHYEIDPDRSEANYRIHKEYKERITAERSRYNAVKIYVEDKSPEKAAAIVNTILSELEGFRNQIIGRRIRSHYQAIQLSRDSLVLEMASWTDSLLQLQNLGVVSKPERAALLESLGNVRGNADIIRNRLDANLMYGAQFDVLERKVEFLQNQISTLDKIRLQLQTNLSPATSQQFIFEYGNVPDKKHAPKRLFVVLGTMGFCLTLVLVYLYLRINWPEARKRLEK